jgi:hypothetical protein
MPYLSREVGDSETVRYGEYEMLTVGDRFPAYRLKSVAANEAKFEEIGERSFPGQWKVCVFWPRNGKKGEETIQLAA